MDYPGTVISAASGSADVKPVAERLAALGYRVPEGGQLEGIIRLYQSQHVDALRKPLHVDGLVGRVTWESLFGPPAVAPKQDIAAMALAQAKSQVGVREQPVGSNGGPQVDRYLASVGVEPGAFWCMAFIHWCFQGAARKLNRPNPFPRTAGCLDAWRRVSEAAPERIVTREEALADATKVRPGAVFILDHGHGMGHTGIVTGVTGAALRTIEGNSNNDGSRNGVGVFELDRRRTTSESLKGFIDFTGA